MRSTTMKTIIIAMILIVIYTSLSSQTYTSYSGCRDTYSQCAPYFRSLNNPNDRANFCNRYGAVCKKFCQKCQSDCKDAYGQGFVCKLYRKQLRCNDSEAAKKCRKTCRYCH